jgi:predicted dehydrogenase
MSSARRVALVGCGRWGVNILRDLLALGCDVPVVAHSDASAARAREVGATTILTGTDELEGVDGVVVATPTITHAEVIESILPLGVPVFVEKPLTITSSSARHLLERAPDRIFQMDKWRYHPGIECLRDLAQSGKLGGVQGVACTRLQWTNPHPDVDGVWILAPHDLSIIYEILGELPDVRAAVATLGSVTDEVELWAALGTQPFATLHVSTCSPVYERRIAVHGTERTAVLADGYSDAVLVYTPGGSDEPERIELDDELPLLRELRAFVEHLDGGPPPRSSAEEAVQAITVLERIRALAGLDPA